MFYQMTFSLANWIAGIKPQGVAITSITGDGTAAGPGAAAFTLNTVNTNVGSGYNNFTVNAKGLITAASIISYLTGNQTITLSGDITGSGSTAITTTLPTVNSNVGTFGSSSLIPVVTVNAKGQVTAVTTSSLTVPTAANPTGAAGNSAVNGTSSNFMRADAAPRVDSTQIINYAHYNGTPATWAVNHYQTLLPLTTNGDVLTYNSGLPVSESAPQVRY